MKRKTAKILIVDDDEDILFSAKVWLKKFFTEVNTLNNPRKIIQELADNSYDIILLDMNFRRGYENGQDGLYWMSEIKAIDPDLPIIMMTAYGEVELAVRALKDGALDFILKPWNNEKLYSSVNLAVEISRKNKKLSQWENIQQKKQNYVLNSHSGKVKKILDTIDKIAPTDANILILGENGTGKYVIAEQIHQKSTRNKEPFVHIDLGTIPENLFESELFGYKKGAFTNAASDTAGKIENAQGGTVFLDEIGNLPLNLQAKLLTLIQNKKISRIGESKERHLDIRFIFATNENLQLKIEQSSFRKDLYFRINAIELYLPPLRERIEDIQIFAHYFLDKYKNKYHKDLELSEHNIQILNSYHWPGNIRELEHIMERSVIFSDENILELSIPQKFNKEEDILNHNSLNIEEMEESLIKKALKKHHGNISFAAKDLGLSRAALYRRMEKFGL